MKLGTRHSKLGSRFAKLGGIVRTVVESEETPGETQQPTYKGMGLSKVNHRATPRRHSLARR